MGDESDTALIDELERRLTAGDLEADKLKAILPDDDDDDEPEEDTVTPEIIRQLSRIVYGGDVFYPADFRELLRQLGIYSQHA